MGWTNSGQDAKAKTIYDYLISSKDPGFMNWYNTAGWNNWPNGVQPGDASRILDAYGGAWDRQGARAPGASYAGSVQEFYDKAYASATGSGGGAGGGTGGRTPGPGAPVDTLQPGTGTGGTGGTAKGGSYVMPDPGTGNTPWQDWLRKVQGWNEPDALSMDTDYTNPQAKADAYLNDLLQNTNASQYLSPFYINRLRNQSLRAPQENALASAAGGNADYAAQTGADALRRFVSGNAGMGMGYEGSRTAMQTLLDRLGAGKAAAANTPGAAGGNAGLWQLLGQDPYAIRDMMTLGIQGPFAQNIRDILYSKTSAANTATMKEGGQDFPWLQYVTQGVPGLGYTWGNPGGGGW